MNEVSPVVHDLARRLIADESGDEAGSDAGITPALLAVARLRLPLTRLAGAEGYKSLLMRALTLAQARAPSLLPLRVDADGSIQGAVDHSFSRSADEAAEGGAVLLAELTGLLFVFIGEALTLQLLRAVWPDATLHPVSDEWKETPR